MTVRDPIASLLDFAVDVEQTPEEAAQELREAGVDVDGFLARVRARRAAEAPADPIDRAREAAENLRKAALWLGACEDDLRAAHASGDAAAIEAAAEAHHRAWHAHREAEAAAKEAGHG